ncbi:MAG TPA: DNA repair protein RadA, partial [Pseudomonas sp.]|nr:DNA repair protein RadA [Pseudomonas sp.]
KPKVMVIDSIQTIFTEQLQSAPGGVSQVRESAALLVRYAKQSGTAIFLVGHVT